MVKSLTPKLNLTPSLTPLIAHHDLNALRQTVRDFKATGQTLGFVPTMGALHEGHLELVRHAKSLCDKVVVSIFVNPKQFAPTEDLALYPRTQTADLEALMRVGCDLVYLPSPDHIYPQGFATKIDMAGPALGLESDFRPHFFAGVATVVTKLFMQVTPDVAIFGHKDYQQLKVVETLVLDLDMGIKIVGHPTRREPDGLAMSSRNAYLSQKERALAPKLYETLNALKADLINGLPVDQAIDKAWATLIAAGFGPIDYLSLRDSDTLGPVDTNTDNRRLLAALWLGSTRLIDNIEA
jgi:pantoate--beta-alanine ligase